MAHSSVTPGRGPNVELALHCLHEARGNILVRSSHWVIIANGLGELLVLVGAGSGSELSVPQAAAWSPCSACGALACCRSPC